MLLMALMLDLRKSKVIIYPEKKDVLILYRLLIGYPFSVIKDLKRKVPSLVRVIVRIFKSASGIIISNTAPE